MLPNTNAIDPLLEAGCCLRLPNASRTSCGNGRRGLTMVWVIVLVAVLLVAVGVALPSTLQQLDAQAETATQKHLLELSDATRGYFRDTLQLPGAVSVLERNPGLAGWAGPYLHAAGIDRQSGLPRAEVDGWSHSLLLSKLSTSVLEIRSAGPNGSQADADDMYTRVDVTPQRAELTLDLIAVVDRSIQSWLDANAGKYKNLPPDLRGALETLAAAGYLPGAKDFAQDAWGVDLLPVVGPEGGTVAVASSNCASSAPQ